MVVEDFSAGGMASSGVQANMAKQVELNKVLAEAGEPLIAVDGIIGNQTLAAESKVAEILAKGGEDPPTDDPPGDDEDPPGDEKDDESDKTLAELEADWKADNPGWDDRTGLSGTQQWILDTVTNADGSITFVPRLSGQDAATIAANAKREADRLRKAENLELRQGAARDVLGSLLRDMFGNDPRFANEVAALTTQLNDLMIKGASELEIVQTIRGSTQYATRFPGMAARAAAGMPAISEAEYIDLERNYRNLMRTSGIEERFYQDPARFGELIAGDVSAAELQSRVALAEEAASSADPEVVRQLEEFYGIDRAKLVEYYLDPEEAVNLFEEERRLAAAGLSAAAVGTVGQAFTQSVAERLEQENIQRREVQQRLGQRIGLTERLLGEEEALTASEIAEAEFGLDAEAVAEMRRRREERTAAFSGASGVLTTRGGITGLGVAE